MRQRRARGIRLLTCDVDGVLTDGRIYVDDDGHEMKAFSALDGVGLKMLMRAGIAVAWITGSNAPAVTHRARALGVHRVVQGAEDKLTPWEALRGELGLPADRLRAHRRRSSRRAGVRRAAASRSRFRTRRRCVRATRALRHRRATAAPAPCASSAS